MVNGRVAEDDDVENAVSNGIFIAPRCLKGFIDAQINSNYYIWYFVAATEEFPAENGIEFQR